MPGVEGVFAGVVLAGGSSRRMGTDKASLEIEGRSLLDRALDGLEAASAAPIIVVGGSTARVPALADTWPGEGPLGGLISGLDAVAVSPHAGVEVAVVLACDLPHIDGRAVADLVERLGREPDADALVPFVDGRPQPLAAAYRVRARHPLREHFQEGERSLLAALSGLVVVEAADLEPHSFHDVDTPEDVLGLRQRP